MAAQCYAFGVSILHTVKLSWPLNPKQLQYLKHCQGVFQYARCVFGENRANEMYEKCIKWMFSSCHGVMNFFNNETVHLKHEARNENF